MSNFVEGITEVHDKDVSLVALVAVTGKVVDELNELGLTRKVFSKPMLQFVEDIVCFSLAHNIAGYDMLKQFAADTCKAYWPVVCCNSLLSLLVYCSDVCVTLILGNNTRGI